MTNKYDYLQRKDIICVNFDLNSFDNMKDKHYWYFLEPLFYTNAHFYHYNRKKKSVLRSFLDSIRTPFRHLTEECDYIEPVNCDTVPEWIVEHFDKCELTGSFMFYEMNNELYLSFLLDEAPKEPLAVETYYGIAKAFGLKLPNYVQDNGTHWMFKSLGENVKTVELFLTWLHNIKMNTHCNMYLATA